MPLEKNKAIIRSLYEAYNKQNLALFDELYAPDYVNPTLQLQGLEDAKNSLRCFSRAFPIGVRLLRTSSLKGIRYAFV